MIFRFGRSPSLTCSFCKLHGENLIHLFSSCSQVISLWIKTKILFSKYTQLALLSPQIATFGLAEGNGKSFLIQNMISMVFKLCLL